MSLAVIALATSALAACSDPATKQTNASPNNGGTNNTVVNNITPNNVSNDDNCGGRLCPGDCIEDGDGWCAVNTFSASFHVAMWVHSPDEIWLADQLGTVRVGSGTTWDEHPAPVEQISDIIGTGSNEVWISTYPPGVFRWDDGEWVEETFVDPLSNEIGIDRFAYHEETDTLFLASRDAIYQRVGEQWEYFAGVEGGELRNVVTCGGRRWFGAGFPVTVDDSGFPARWGTVDFNWIDAATVLESGEVVAGGDQVIFYDGNYKHLAATFVNRASSLTGTSLRDIWAVVPRLNNSEIWHYDGRSWTLVTEYDGLREATTVFTDTPGRVRVVFESGASEVIDGEGNVVSSVEPTSSAGFEAVRSHHLSLDEYWVAGSSLHRWTASNGWDTSSAPSGTIAVWGTSADDVWFLTDWESIHRSNETDHELVPTGIQLSESLEIITGTETGHVWVAGTDQVVQWNGTEWIDHVDFNEGGELPDNDVELTAVGDEAWIFQGDDVFHWDGASWDHIAPQRDVIRVGCENGEMVAMASYPPAMLRGEPDRLTSFGDIPTDTERSASHAWMTSEDDAWVITHRTPKVHRWNGDEFVVSIDTAGEQLTDIQVLPSGHAYLLATKMLFERKP